MLSRPLCGRESIKINVVYYKSMRVAGTPDKDRFKVDISLWICHIIAFCLIVKTCPKERAEEIQNVENGKEAMPCDAE